ncbi:MAG: excisionase family DNA binding protein [Planctomycetaceae bacterium]|jgi:excisionase family DNA binding protein
MNSATSPSADGDTKLAIRYREAAKALDVCERTIWGLVRDGKLRNIRVGRAVRIPVAELERFIAEE